jgi:hypothetical protein
MIPAPRTAPAAACRRRRALLACFAAGALLRPAAGTGDMAVWISRPQSGQNCLSSEGVAVSGTVYASAATNGPVVIDNVNVFSGSNLLGPAASLATNTWGQYVWSYLWSTPPLGTATLSAVAHSLSGASATSAAITVTIVTSNTVPVACDISAATVEGGSATLWPSFTHSDAGQTVTVSVASDPSGGAVTLTNRGGGGVTGGSGYPGNGEGASYSFIYRPRAGFTGTDAFTYKGNDGYEDSNIATARITVAANVAPIA